MIVVRTVVAAELESRSPPVAGVQHEMTCRSEVPSDLTQLLRMTLNAARALRR